MVYRIRFPLSLLGTVGLVAMACGLELVELGEAVPAAESVAQVPSRPVNNGVEVVDESQGNFLPSIQDASVSSEAQVSVRFPGLAEDGGVSALTRCQKADILFVVDNSRSMADKQEALVRSFPSFIATLQNTLQLQDYHLMAVDTDGDRLDAADFPLSDSDCDDALGAGRREDSEGGSCGTLENKRYIQEGQQDLAATFTCVAAAGDSGSARERPIEAALRAVSDLLNGTGGCNQGFLRSDAILVVVWITDEDDTRSDGDPNDWHQALVTAKHGQPDAIVPLALLGPRDDDESSEICAEGLDVDEAPRIHELIDSFRAGVVGNICAEDYTSFFLDAVTTVSRACSNLAIVNGE